MQEIVTRVLEAEKKAEGTIREARSKAVEIRAGADREVEAMLREAREQGRKRAQEIVDAARRREQSEYERAVKQAGEEEQAFFQSHEEHIRQAVEAVVSLLTTPEWAQE